MYHRFGLIRLVVWSAHGDVEGSRLPELAGRTVPFRSPLELGDGSFSTSELNFTVWVASELGRSSI